MKNRKILKSFKYAFNGIITSFKTEKNPRKKLSKLPRVKVKHSNRNNSRYDNNGKK